MNEYVSMLAICWKGYSKSYQHVARNVGENVGRKCCSICAHLTFNMTEESNKELAFFDTVLARNNGKISRLV